MKRTQSLRDYEEGLVRYSEAVRQLGAPSDPVFGLPQQAIFLANLRASPYVASAARAAGMKISTVYSYRKNNPDFAELWDQAKLEGYETLEQEAHRRAAIGVKREIYYKGDVCGVEQVYSDSLLMFLLKAHDPDGRHTSKSETKLDATMDVTEMQISRKQALKLALLNKYAVEAGADMTLTKAEQEAAELKRLME